MLCASPDVCGAHPMTDSQRAAQSSASVCCRIAGGGCGVDRNRTSKRPRLTPPAPIQPKPHMCVNRKRLNRGEISSAFANRSMCAVQPHRGDLERVRMPNEPIYSRAHTSVHSGLQQLSTCVRESPTSASPDRNKKAQSND